MRNTHISIRKTISPFLSPRDQMCMAFIKPSCMAQPIAAVFLKLKVTCAWTAPLSFTHKLLLDRNAFATLASIILALNASIILALNASMAFSHSPLPSSPRCACYMLIKACISTEVLTFKFSQHCNPFFSWPPCLSVPWLPACCCS